MEKKGDLANRERVNFVLSSQVIEMLREKSARDSVPMSRIIDAAVASYLEPSGMQSRGNAKNGITLFHHLEIKLLLPFEGKQTGEILQSIRKCFPDRAVTPCLYAGDPGNQPIVGTKIEVYFSEEQGERFAECLAALGTRPEKEQIRLQMDLQPIDL